MKIKKFLLIVLIISTLICTSCDVYFPKRKVIYISNLYEGDEFQLNTCLVEVGNINVNYIKYGEFIPDEQKSEYVEFDINGMIEEIFVSKYEIVEKGQLIASLNVLKVKENILYQEINTEKAQVTYENALIDYENKLIDSYRLEMYKLLLMSNENYLSDLHEYYEKSYIYAPKQGSIVEIYKDVGESSIGNVIKICNLEDGIVRITTEKEANEAEVNYGIAQPKIISHLDNVFNSIEQESKLSIKFYDELHSGYLFRNINTFMLLFGENHDLNYIDIKFDNLPKSLNFDIPVTIIYNEVDLKNIIIVNENSIYNDVDGEKYVFIVIDNKTTIRKIKTGLSSEGYTHVISGLEVGEEVLLTK